jgi:hypothetical protein
MVFVLAAFPRFRAALLGATEASPSVAIFNLKLTPNDIRVIYVAHKAHGRLAEQYASQALVGDHTLEWEQRLQKLKKLGLAEPSPYTNIVGGCSAILSGEGRGVAELIEQFARPIIELEKKRTTPLS